MVSYTVLVHGICERQALESVAAVLVMFQFGIEYEGVYGMKNHMLSA